MQQLKINEFDISKKKKKKNDIGGHLVSPLGGCGGLEITDFNIFYFGWMWWS